MLRECKPRVLSLERGWGNVPESAGHVFPVLSVTLVTFYPMLCHKEPCLSNFPRVAAGSRSSATMHSQLLAHTGAQEMFH